MPSPIWAGRCRRPRLSSCARLDAQKLDVERAREAARSNGLLLSYGSRPVDWYRINELKHSVSEGRLEQVRVIAAVLSGD